MSKTTKEEKIVLIQTKLQRNDKSIMLSDIMKALPYHIDISGLAGAWKLRTDKVAVTYIYDQDDAALDLIIDLFNKHNM